MIPHAAHMIRSSESCVKHNTSETLLYQKSRMRFSSAGTFDRAQDLENLILPQCHCLNTQSGCWPSLRFHCKDERVTRILLHSTSWMFPQVSSSVGVFIYALWIPHIPNPHGSFCVSNLIQCRSGDHKWSRRCDDRHLKATTCRGWNLRWRVTDSAEDAP